MEVQISHPAEEQEEKTAVKALCKLKSTLSSCEI